jgi:3-phenylpropionate/trans-cinnamate dioxygenase ferredoxin reductase subunit
VAARHADFLLIGGGVAAASCARELRSAGAEGSILLVSREKDPPYERPPLSKSYLAGGSTREDASYLPSGWWEENDVELVLRTSVMKLDTEARVARLSTKEEVSYGTALIATGANVRRLRVDGSDLDGIHYLRAFGNADAIRAEALEARRVVLIGGSYIACELAATLTGLGVGCSMLMQEDVVLERVLGREVGGWVQRQLEERGVEVHGGDELERFEPAGGGGDEDEPGRVGRVISRGGLALPCDCVAIGAGVTPDVMLARSAGLDLGPLGGVLCSAGLETSASGVFAAGDVAEYESPLHDSGRARVEHFEVAVEHGRVAARNMLAATAARADSAPGSASAPGAGSAPTAPGGGSAPTAPGSASAPDSGSAPTAAGAGSAPVATVDGLVPYFWSDLSDWATIEYVGVGSGRATVRGSLDEGSFTAFYSVEGDDRLVGAATVGRPDDLEHARRMIRARATPNRSALEDEATDLASL